MSHNDNDNDDLIADGWQVTYLSVVPPLIDKVLQSFALDALRLNLSTVRYITSGAVGLSNNTAEKILQVMPQVQLQQGKHSGGNTQWMLTLYDIRCNMSVPAYGSWNKNNVNCCIAVFLIGDLAKFIYIAKKNEERKERKGEWEMKEELWLWENSHTFE